MRTAMIAMTTSSSIRVNPPRLTLMVKVSPARGDGKESRSGRRDIIDPGRQVGDGRRARRAELVDDHGGSNRGQLDGFPERGAGGEGCGQVRRDSVAGAHDVDRSAHRDGLNVLDRSVRRGGDDAPLGKRHEYRAAVAAGQGRGG